MCVQSVVVCALSVVCVLLMSEGAVARVGHFTHYWAVHVEGGRPVADQVAAEHGFINLDEIIPDHYHFRHNSVHKRSANPSPHHHTKLTNDGRVRWAQQQRILSRKKRDFIPLTMLLKSTSSPADVRLTSAGFTNSPSSTSSGGIRPDRDLIPPFFQADRRLRNIPIPSVLSSYFPLNDQLWPKMWYLNRGSGLDMNVVAAWREGITGKGVVVTILDDGLEKDHPDLLVNYDPQASYDVNNHDEDPMPRYDMIDSNRHGTRCAGEVAATANNSLCAVGIAFGANVGGVRMLDGDVTDAVEARSLSLNPQHIDIYSASWGPDDDGKTVDGPGEMATRAFIEGVTKGRSGKGSIFVWASGNGGNERDNCNCDGYTNSIWTLSISSATENGDVPWYSEMCSSTLATTYSSGSSTERQVITTDLHHSCTSSHTGTSASAPLAAGICALALEANKDLTWRDMQHIVVRTAKPANLQQSGWRTNGVGRNVSHSFGYGLMDAAAMVRMARTWKTVPIQHRCEVSSQHVNKPIPPKSVVMLQLNVDHCAGVNYLEHVQAKITLSAPRRGDLMINLTSPAGTMVTLLATRSRDVSRAGFVAWPFMSVHTWGESPYGIWQLKIHNEGKYMGRATLQDWSLIFYGTSSPADKNDPSPYNNLYKINISQSVLVPSITIPTNKNRNKSSGKGQGNPNNISPPYVVNANGNPRKNKNSKNSHRNSQGKNKSSVKPTVTSLRGITNKTLMYNKQYGNGKGPQRQTDSRLGGGSRTTPPHSQYPTDKPRQGVTALPNTTKSTKFDKTTKPFKANNLDPSSSFVQPAKIQKNVSKQPNIDMSLKADRYETTAAKKSDFRVTEKFSATTKSYHQSMTTSDDYTPTNPPPNFQGFIFIDQPPDGHTAIINSKIPSLFQKYPKAQHIYPALYPYPKVEVIGNKPSRQHPSPSQFHHELYMGGLIAQDSLDSEIERGYHDTRISADDKAELSKWNLIFFGTETPAQPDSDFVPGSKIDPLNSGGNLGIGEGEAGHHNFVQDEYVPNKWRDEQKVREEGRIELRPGEPNPGTAEFASSGCLNYSPSQPLQCIECHQSLYLHDGQCVPGCPDKTFATSLFQYKPQPKPLTLQSDDNPISSSLRRSPKTNEFDPRAVMKPQPHKICEACHYTCTNCTGPLNYHCTSCPDDAKLINSSNASGFVETYCYPTKLLPELENAVWFKRFYLFFGIAAFVIVCAIFYFVISNLLMNFDLCNKSRHQEKAQSNIGYDRLNRDEKTKIDIESEINRTIYDSDSDTSV